MNATQPRATETGTLVGVRLQAPDLEALDAWRREQADLPTRPEAMRRLFLAGLSATAEPPEGKPVRKASPPKTARKTRPVGN